MKSFSRAHVFFLLWKTPKEGQESPDTLDDFEFIKMSFAGLSGDRYFPLSLSLFFFVTKSKFCVELGKRKKFFFSEFVSVRIQFLGEKKSPLCTPRLLCQLTYKASPEDPPPLYFSCAARKIIQKFFFTLSTKNMVFFLFEFKLVLYN